METRTVAEELAAALHLFVRAGHGNSTHFELQEQAHAAANRALSRYHDERQATPAADVVRADNGSYALFWRDGKNITDFVGQTLYTVRSGIAPNANPDRDANA